MGNYNQYKNKCIKGKKDHNYWQWHTKGNAVTLFITNGTACEYFTDHFKYTSQHIFVSNFKHHMSTRAWITTHYIGLVRETLCARGLITLQIWRLKRIIIHQTILLRNHLHLHIPHLWHPKAQRWVLCVSSSLYTWHPNRCTCSLKVLWKLFHWYQIWQQLS